MNKKLKKALQNAFEPPKPIHEKEFIKQFPQPTISTLSFVLSQIRYIQKYVWIVSFAVFLIALMGARAFEKDVLWVISALIPFIALSLVTENARSNTYSMAEFEMSAPLFSKKYCPCSDGNFRGMSFDFTRNTNSIKCCI